MTKLALINQQTMVCENVTEDSRPAAEVIVEGYIVLDLAVTPCKSWRLDRETNLWVECEGLVGSGGISDVWDGEKLNAPKPADPLPPTN
jgi:hypothetical protein